MARKVTVLIVYLLLLAGHVTAQQASPAVEPGGASETAVKVPTQASEDFTIVEVLEAMLRDLRGEIRELRHELREEMRELTDRAVEESQRTVREGLNDTRRLYVAVQNRVADSTVEMGPGEEKDINTVYPATSAGFVTATANLKGAGRCVLLGHASAETKSLKSPRDPRYLRGVSALQYAPGGGPNHEDINPYIPLGSIAFPVREKEFWTVTGCDHYDTRVIFYTLELSGK